MEPFDETPQGSNPLLFGIVLAVLLVALVVYLFLANVGVVRVAVTDQVQQIERNTVMEKHEKHQQDIAPIQHGMDVYAVAQELRNCWRLRGQRYDKSFITLTLEFNRDHTVRTIRVADAQQLQYATDPAFKKIADSAIAALPSCPVYKTFPVNEYDFWKKLDLTFDARSSTQH